MVTDPVCGMPIDPQAAGVRATYSGKTYFFCSENCKQQFEHAPAYYAEHAAPQPGQQATPRGETVLTRDEDTRSQGVDVVTEHPHSMTSGTDVIESSPSGTRSSGADVIESTTPRESQETQESGGAG